MQYIETSVKRDMKNNLMYSVVTVDILFSLIELLLTEFFIEQAAGLQVVPAMESVKFSFGNNVF